MPSGGDNKDPDRGYNFVSVDPSAPGEKADSRSLIRANAGRYIWEQRRQTTTSSKARSKKGNVDRPSKQQGNPSRSLPTRLPNRHREAAVACSVGNGQTVLTPPPDDDDPHPVDMIFDESSMTLLKKEPDEEEEQRTNLMAIDNVHQDSQTLALDAGVSSLFASYPSDLDERAARRLIHYGEFSIL